MNWFEQRIRRYEHRRWTTDDNRRVRPFEWGTEHVDGERDEAHPEGFLAEYATRALKNSKEWYETVPAADYLVDAENVLTFSASIESQWPEDNIENARLF